MSAVARGELHPLDLHGVFLRRTDWSGADLEDANFADADLANAIFRRANLKNANLRGANLRGADFTEATNLTREQLAVAETDPSTRLPSYLSSARA